MIESALWIAAALLALLSIYTFATHLWIIILAIRRGGLRHAPSFVPIVAGVSGAIAIAIVPFEGVAHLFWIPLIADWTCLGLALLPFVLIVDWLRGKRA